MRKFKFKAVVVLAVVLMVALTGCAELGDMMSVIKGSLVGNSYTIYQYDNTGNQTMTFSGNSIDISPFEASTDADGNTVITDVLNITIDGGQMLAVGNTLIFEEQGLDKLAGFADISKFADSFAKTGTHFIPYDKLINDVMNSMGKARMILVYSQLGEPLAMYQGDAVYVTVPDDLPKMTRLNIDGKSLYLHRVNYTIIDTNLAKR